jgi:vitamin B12 transporter
VSASLLSFARVSLAQVDGGLSVPSGDVVARQVRLSLPGEESPDVEARMTLNGLGDRDVGHFVDGVPVDVAGLGPALAFAPPGAVDRVEVHRGAVPLRLTADAVGAAVNVISEVAPAGTRAGAWAELGSFGSYRVAGALRGRHGPTGVVASVDGFVARARNDYPVNVEVTDELGGVTAARLPRFHAGHAAFGGRAEVGVVDRSWAKRLTVQMNGMRAARELQHDLVMSAPWGEARTSASSLGTVVHYQQPRVGDTPVGVEAVVAGNRRSIDLDDRSLWAYDWFGRRARERMTPGELAARPADSPVWQHTGLGRLAASWARSPSHTLRLVAAPTFVERASAGMFTLVGGLEYQVAMFGGRLEVLGSGKSYLLRTRAEDVMEGATARPLTRRVQAWGFGESLRLRLTSCSWVHLAFERATRLPRADELFGDGVLVAANPGLRPQRNRNVNAGLSLDLAQTRAGGFRADVNAFIRRSEQLVLLPGDMPVMSHMNLPSARGHGLEAVAGWTSPGAYLVIDGRMSWQDLRNRSGDGADGAFAGQRVPNQPRLLAGTTTRVRQTGVLGDGDELSLGHDLSHVGVFDRGWASSAAPSRAMIPARTTHSLWLSYASVGTLALRWTAEIRNVGDARSYDAYGVERPGRAVFLRVAAERRR